MMNSRLPPWMTGTDTPQAPGVTGLFEQMLAKGMPMHMAMNTGDDQFQGMPPADLGAASTGIPAAMQIPSGMPTGMTPMDPRVRDYLLSLQRQQMQSQPMPGVTGGRFMGDSAWPNR